MNGWVRWLEGRGLYEPGAEPSAWTDWRNLGLLIVIWFLGAALLLGLLALAG